MVKNKLTGEVEDYWRCSGKSTSQALTYIANAISSGKEIEVRDHYPTLNADRLLLQTCKSIVEKLDLKFFKFNKNKNTMCCELFEKEEVG